ncbi:hypothetical protein AOLI_G00125480 [Acnodon oligacanthus]
MLTVLKRDEASSPVGILPSRERPAHLCPPEGTVATAAVTASAGNKVLLTLPLTPSAAARHPLPRQARDHSFRGVKTEVKTTDSHAPCQKEDGSLAVVSRTEFDVTPESAWSTVCSRHFL